MKPQDEQRNIRSNEPPYRRRDFDPVALATLVGVVGLLMITFTTMRDTDRLDRSLGERIGKLEGQVANLASRPAGPAAAPAAQDPNRVYVVNVAADSPIRGRTNAPVTIVEFSDFQ